MNNYQGLLRASIATAGQDHRLGANEAPPAIMSVFLGSALERCSARSPTTAPSASAPGDFLGLGTPVLPHLPKHSGDRNRTSPFAFTGNKFEFRALGSSMSPSLPNTVLNTIVASTIDELGAKVREALESGADLEAAVVGVVKDAYTANRGIVFDGDGYSEEWHAEAERRGLLNLRSTPDALPELVSEQTKATFAAYDVLSARELESRYEVFVEQYVVKVNIEAETAASIARTMLLPASLRHLAELRAARDRDARGRDRGSREHAHRRGPRAREGQRRTTRGRGPRARDLHARHGDPGDGRHPRGGGRSRADRGRRPLAAAEVPGDAVHQVAVADVLTGTPPVSVCSTTQ